MRLTGAIFDLDGTLLDSMPYWETVGLRYLESRQVSGFDAVQIALKLKTLTLWEAAEFFRQEFGITETVDEICAAITEMIADDYRYRAPLKDGVEPVLRLMQAKGVRMCVASATNHALVSAALRRVGVRDCFDFILTCGDLHTSKNQPYIYDECTRRLGTSKETTGVFEDSLHCITTVSRENYPTVAVYDRSAASEENEIRALCDLYLRDWHSFRPEDVGLSD